MVILDNEISNAGRAEKNTRGAGDEKNKHAPEDRGDDQRS